MKKHPRTGVYICECGHNIGGVVDVKKVTEYAKTLPPVVVARYNKYTCSELGQSSIAKDIRDHKLERVVVASCSPSLHEHIFQKVLEGSGLNPYLFEMVNIREQCSWVHHNEPEKATEKAKDLVRAAVMRATLLEPLEKPTKSVEKSALVIGGGIGGISAALYLANNGVKTYLVEKEPSIGGHMAMLDKTFPTLDCSLCILSPRMVEVRQNPNIELLANSDVVEISGSVGDFRVKIKKRPRFVDPDKCVACGACSAKCPTKVKDDFNFGFSERKAIYIPFPQAVPNCYLIDKNNCLYLNKGVCRICEKTCERKAIDFNQKEEVIELKAGAIVVATGFDLFDASEKKQYGYKCYPNVISNLDFERLINASGPTDGKLKRPSDGKSPQSVAFIQCVGSRDKNTASYCSRVCCMITVKQALLIKEKYPETEVFVYYTDMRTPGKNFEEFYEKARSKGVVFIRGKPGEITESAESRLRILAEDIDSGILLDNEIDLVVLAAGLRPPKELRDLAQKLHASLSPDGFLAEAHPKLHPTETNIDGVFLAGCVQFPKDIPDTVATAGNAAAGVLNLLNKDRIEAESITAWVDIKKCSGCGSCILVCPYDAISLDEDGKAVVDEIVCKGCGSCVATCLSGAIQQRHYTDKQLISQLKALLKDGKV